jgi:hypothetical protein
MERSKRKIVAKNWIQGMKMKKGALHSQLGVPQDEKIPAGKLAEAASKGGVLGKRARLAQTFRKMKKKKTRQHVKEALK